MDCIKKNEKSLVLDGWMVGWVNVWMDGLKSCFKDFLQQSKIGLGQLAQSENFAFIKIVSSRGPRTIQQEARIFSWQLKCNFKF